MDLVTRVTDAYLQTLEGSSAARLRFLEGLWDIQSRIAAVNRPYEAPDAQTSRDALVTGQQLFLMSAPAIPVAEYVDAANRIAAYASEMAGLPAEQAEALSAVDFSEAVGATQLASAPGCPDAFVAEIVAQMSALPDSPLTPASVAFVLASALVPFLVGPAARVLEVVGEIDGGLWTEGRCPVCGAAASAGRMSETTQLSGAQRTLWCGMCHTEWGIERIKCARCGTRNPDMLHYTYVEQDPAHRLHLCEQCHGYMRFVFVDDLELPVAMVVEDAVMTTLDAVASEQGYSATGDGGASSC